MPKSKLGEIYDIFNSMKTFYSKINIYNMYESKKRKCDIYKTSNMRNNILLLIFVYVAYKKCMLHVCNYV